MLFSDVVKQFLEERVAMRYSPYTIRDYKVTFMKFIRHFGDKEIGEIEKRHIIQFLGSQTQVCAKTLRNYHADLSALWQWAVKEGFCNTNPIRQIKAPIPERKSIAPLTKTEILALLEIARQSSHPKRNQLLILMLIDTGMRASELCNIRLGDINWVTRHVIVIGKGKKERLIPFSAETAEFLRDYLSTRTKSVPSQPLFTTNNGTPLDRCGLRNILSELGRQAGISKVHPHRFRHTFAIEFLRNGGNIYSLQKILGHSTLDMVKRYLAISQNDMDHDHAIASPVKCWNLV